VVDAPGVLEAGGVVAGVLDAGAVLAGVVAGVVDPGGFREDADVRGADMRQ
jgi:hypothetical protein